MKARTKALVVVVLVAVMALLVGSAVPGHAGSRVFVGVGVGAPFWYPYPYPFPYPFPYPYAYPYGYPYPVYSPPVVQQPPVYVQPQTAPAPTQYWYYCQASQAYYPYVRECPGGWMQVVPQTGPVAPSPGAPPR